MSDEIIRVAIVTVSDRCSRGEAVDSSGPALAAIARKLINAETVASYCVSDEIDEIAQTLREIAASEPAPVLILTTGGTGLSARDVTPEATVQVLEREHPGLMELVRLRCGQKTTRAYLSRGRAGTIKSTLVVNLPGSTRGAVESFEAIAEILPHAVGVLSGTETDHPR